MLLSGVVGLKRGVEAYFSARGIQAPVRIGWKERSRLDNRGPDGASRVVFVPGEFDPSGTSPRPLRAGRIDRVGAQNMIDGAPRYRALGWWHESLTCSVWAVNPADPQNEEGQIEATEALLEQTMQGIHNAMDPQTSMAVGFGNLEEWGEPFWTLPPGEQAFGRELTFGLVLLVPLFDVPIDVGPAAPEVSRGPFLPV